MKSLGVTLELRQVPFYFVALSLGALTSVVVGENKLLQSSLIPALAVMLFVTFLQLPIGALRNALREGRFVGAVLLTNFVGLPLVTVLLLQLLPDEAMLRLAVAFVLLTPCIDYVVTFTHLGKGDARLLVSITPLLLLMQVILLPLYLDAMLGQDARALIAIGPFVQAFVWLIAVPLLLAAIVQLLQKRYRAACSARETLDLLPVPATAVVLFLVMATVTPHLGLALEGVLRALPVYVAFAAVAPLLAGLISRWLRLQPAAQRSLMFSAAYRNSLVILPVALTIPGGAPLVPAVILTQTLVELFCMPLYVRWIPRFVRTETKLDEPDR